MVYNIKKTDGTPLVSIPDSTQDTTSSSLTLPGRNSVNFGLSINQNFIDLLQNFASTSSPPNALQGQLWFDTINNDLKVYNGSKWITISIGIDGSSGVIDIQAGPNNTDLTLIISQYQIINVISGDHIAKSDCPDTIVYNDISYAFASRFPNGIFPGLNIATDPSGIIDYWLQGKATYANVLVHPRTVYINGSTVGSFTFDGSKNVNVTVKDSNVYVGNTNVTVAGTWTKVLVSDGGRIISGNNLTSSDVVAALGYTPFAGGNVNVNAIGNTIVARDNNANFAANVIIVNDFIANYTVQANVISATQFVGTARDAVKLTNSPTIYLDGDVYGNVTLHGNTNVILSTNLLTTGVTAGIYNLVNVDTKGRVTNGGYYDLVPFGMICLFQEGIAPAGYAECNGQLVVDVTTGLTTQTPNLIAASQNLSIGTGSTLKYYIKYIVSPPMSRTANIAAGTPGGGTPIYINGEVVNQTTQVPNLQVTLTSGLTTQQIEPKFVPIEQISEPVVEVTSAQYQTTNFKDITYYNSIALVMSLGDYNAIMFSTYDVWNNFTSLTVQNIIDNLNLRATQNLPAFVGKYMISLSLLKQQVSILGIPSNTSFSPILQDQIMSSLTSLFTHRLQLAKIPVNKVTLFGCHYFGSADAMIAIMKSEQNDKVSDTLHKMGYYTTTSSGLENYTRDEFLAVITAIMEIAEQDIEYRKEVQQNVIVSGNWISTSNSNVIVTSPTISGYYIGDNNFKDMQGGYFPEYDMLVSDVKTSDAIILPSVTKGSIGTVTFELVDAGAAALVGVMQTSNKWDQVGQAQLCINRLGATISGKIDYNGKNGFDIATAKDAFTALSAAIYGPNSNKEASDKYGDLYININELKEALSIGYKPQFIDALTGVFNFKLSYDELNRVYELREQIWRNGPEINQAQNAVSNAVESVPPTANASEVVRKPFGRDAYGYLTTSSLEGFYVPNTSDTLTSSPAPSPLILLERLVNNLEEPTPETLNNLPILSNQSNTVSGGNTISTGTSIEEKSITNKSVSNEPSSVLNITKQIITNNPAWNWWNFYKN